MTDELVILAIVYLAMFASLGFAVRARLRLRYEQGRLDALNALERGDHLKDKTE